MASKKAYPERVHPGMARAAIAKATQRSHVYTEYILIHYHQTGSFAPDCDARDLYAWLEEHMLAEIEKITMSSQKKRASSTLELPL